MKVTVLQAYLSKKYIRHRNTLNNKEKKMDG